jgi:NADH-quinone oxidoreductase subunit F
MEGDIDLLYDVAKNIEGRTICALGEAAAWPVYFTIERFREDFEKRVKPGLKVESPNRVHGLRKGGLEPVQVHVPVVERT